MSVLSFTEARHLVSRTGFGSELNIIRKVDAKERDVAVETLLRAPRNFTVPMPVLKSLHAPDSMALLKKKKLVAKDIKTVRYWALEQALKNPNAMQEKMTWFWHNHFTSKISTSDRMIQYMVWQTKFIRKNALKNFADMLRAIPYDHMMLRYLDGIKNTKDSPNENFARELLELFTLGEGHYTEQDVREVGRAFTGWTIRRDNKVVRDPSKFDDGMKTILGQRGRFDGDDVIEILLRHPRTAEWIAEKMWYTFVSIVEPDPRIIRKWAKVFRDSGYDISKLLKAVLSSRAFWHPAARATLIKSPLDLIIGTMRTFGLDGNDMPYSTINLRLIRLGQKIYAPPDVKGWAGGMSWINDSTIVVRHHIITSILRVNGVHSRPRKNKNNDSMLADDAFPKLNEKHWDKWLLPEKAVTEVDYSSKAKRLYAIMLDPAFQLK